MAALRDVDPFTGEVLAPSAPMSDAAAWDGLDFFGSADPGDSSTLDDDPPGLAPQIAMVSAEDVDEGAGQAPLPPVLPVWSLMCPDDATEQLAGLWQWVRWLVETHELERQILPCWPLHGPAVEVLTALYQGWLEVYLQPWGQDAQKSAKPGHGALVWLDHLDNRVARLDRTLGRCSGMHEELTRSHADWQAETETYLGRRAQPAAPPVVG